MKLGFWDGLGKPISAGFGGQLVQTVPQNLLLSSPVLFEDFENFSLWPTSGGPTLSDDSVNFVTGAKSMHVITASGTNGVATKVVNLDLSSFNGNLRLYIYFDSLADVAKNGGIILYLSSTTNFAKYFTVTLSGFDVGWNVVNLRTADWTNSGGDSWTNPIIRARITTTALASQRAVVNYDTYEGGGTVRPTVLFSFDDIHPSTYLQAFPYLLSKNMVGTAYIISDNIGGVGYATSAQLQEMYVRGWDIGNHSQTHTDFTTLTQGQIQTELTNCKNVLDGLGLTRASAHVAYPFGTRNDTVYAAMVAAGMLSGRKVSNASTTLSPSTRLTTPLIEWKTLPTFSIDVSTSLATAKSYVDRALSRGEVLTILIHQLVVSGAGANQWLVSDFQSVVDYVYALGFQSLTISEFYSLRNGNIAVNHR